jgi:hypothetical protein
MSTPAPAAPVPPGTLRVVRETGAGYLLLVPEGTSPDDLPPELLPTGAPPPAPYPGGEGVHIDRERHTVHADGAELDLTYLEFALLAHLAQYPQRVHSREHLVSTVWGYAHHIGDGRTVDVHIARLRRKLGPKYRRQIVTIRRVGYKYKP